MSSSALRADNHDFAQECSCQPAVVSVPVNWIRTLSTLPDNAVILGRVPGRTVWEKYRGLWWTPGSVNPHSDHDVSAYGPFTVVRGALNCQCAVGLAADLEVAAGTKRRARLCVTGQWIGGLTTSDRAAIDNHLDEGRTVADLLRAARARGYHGGQSVFYRHFGGECSCMR
ncbi:hypothetical protein [Nocardia terpenica]|uniref:Uncharacterized protein n=1 Tax=Nocardia terpenica TaxID=455432 RepID=A0A6G9Z0N0_9NOCA|nr:hypothetical protein [Nocardia terpenica]QIS18563.1 hypothetical protein F6W96_09925 [Nocardia terpenica]